MKSLGEVAGLAGSASAPVEADGDGLESRTGEVSAKAARVPTRAFVLKTKAPEDGRWLTLGFLDMRVDQSGGVATLFPDAGGPRQRVAVFPFARRLPETVGDAP